MLTADEISTVYGLVVNEVITSIGTEAFSGYKKLEYTTLPSTLETIGNKAFYNCSALYDIELPKGLKSVGSSSFSHCNSITEIVFPDSLESISNHAFEFSGVTKVTFGRGLKSIGGHSFGTTSLGTSYYRGTEKEWKAIKQEVGNYTGIEEVVYLATCSDANEDKVVTIADAVLIMQKIGNADEYKLTEIGSLNADVLDVCDGVTSGDALAIQMVLANLITIDDLPTTTEIVSGI